MIRIKASLESADGFWDHTMSDEGIIRDAHAENDGTQDKFGLHSIPCSGSFLLWSLLWFGFAKAKQFKSLMEIE